MQTLRKRNSPCKFKNQPARFLGDGVSFKAKLIGILEVSEARGDRMCQTALTDLKVAIRAAGEHKQRITVQISIDGLRLRDDKTGDILFHHPVHKISFIAQDMNDSRAFGYIFGSPDTGHRFFGIKTDKAALQVVMAMRDLFQVVFELKKKEIEMEKKDIETTIKFHSGGIFMEPSPDTKGAAGSEAVSLHRAFSEVDKTVGRKHESQTGTVADLLDLQIELNSLQQGIHQLDKMMPEARRPSSEDPFEADPFGDSFTNVKAKESVQPILPPPPTTLKRGHLERQQTISAAPSTSESSSPATTQPSSKTPPPQGSVHWFDKETEDLFTDGELTSLTRNSTGEKDKDSSESTTPRSDYKSQQVDVFTELDPLGSGLIKPYVDKKDFFSNLKNPPKKVLKDLAVTSTMGDTFPTNFNIPTEPIQPVKIQSTIATTSSSDDFEHTSFANFDKFEEKEEPKVSSPQKTGKDFTLSTIHHQPLSVSLPPEDATTHKCTSGHYVSTSSIKELKKESHVIDTDKDGRYASPKRFSRRTDFSADTSTFRRQTSIDKSFPIDFSSLSDEYSPSSPSLKNTRNTNSSESSNQLRGMSSSSAESENVPEPPPRSSGSIVINPPPLPPKKQCSRSTIKPPPRPPHSDGQFHYDFLERDENSPSPTRKDRHKCCSREGQSRFDDNFSPPLPQLPKRLESGEFANSSFEDSFNNMIPSSLSSFFQNSMSIDKTTETKKNKPSLDITLSQLTSTNLSELASSLDMSVAQLTSLTLQQLTECLSNLSRRDSVFEENKESSTTQQMKDPLTVKTSTITSTITSTTTSTTTTSTTISKSQGTPLSESIFQSDKKSNDNDMYDKYAVFRELVEMEQKCEEIKVNTDSKLDEEKEITEKLEEKDNQIDVNADADDNDDEDDNEEDEDDFEKFEEDVDDDDGEEEEETEDIDKQRNEGRLSDRVESEDRDESLVSLTNLTVKLPSVSEDLKAESSYDKVETSSLTSKLVEDKSEDDIKSQESLKLTKMESEKSNSDINAEQDVDKKSSILQERSEITEKKSEIKTSISTSSDRYAALREIIDETESFAKPDTEQVSFAVSPNKSVAEKSVNEIDLMNLFSDTFYQSTSTTAESQKVSVKKEEDSKSSVMDIFEEIKMLNNSTNSIQRESNTALLSKFENVFCPFSESKTEAKGEDNKDDDNWAKFNSNVFSSDKSSGEGHGSDGGTSPWSPDGKEFHREPLRTKSAPGPNRYSGDSDIECKDDEESEESNGRMRSDRSWGPSSSGRMPREYYEETMDLGERSRSFRDVMGRKTRGAPWVKGTGHRRDPSPWHEEDRWEERRRYMHRKFPHKDDEDYQHNLAHWKCITQHRAWKNGGSGSGSGGGVGGGGGGGGGGGSSSGSVGERESFWPHDPTPSSHSFYEDERLKRRMMPWTDEEMNRQDAGSRIDRFSSQESMGYEDDERWPRRWDDYDRSDRRRWEEDGTFWNRRGVMMESDYSSHMYRKHESHYCRERGLQGPHPLPPHERDYHIPGSWEDEEEDYSPDRPEDSPRYIARNKRHWPKRPNSANDDRSVEMSCYPNVRPKYNMSRSECSDNDSDPYHRSRRSRSRDRIYWGSDQEFDSWGESSLPPSHWSEVSPSTLSHPPSSGITDVKSETLHRRRMNRHRVRPQIKHGQQTSPFEDDFIQSLDRRSEVSLESVGPEQQRSPRMVDLDIKQQQHQSNISPRNVKDTRRDPKTHKSSSYFEDDLTPTASVSSDASDRQNRIGFGSGSDLKATPEELVSDAREPKNVQGDNFIAEEGGRGMKTFFNGGDSRFDDDAFTFRSELEDQVPDKATTIPQKNNTRQMKYSGKNQYIKKSESVNIFSRENDPFDDDFFN